MKFTLSWLKEHIDTDASVDEITEEWIISTLQENDAVSLSLALPGLDESCIGYLLNLRNCESGIEVCDVTQRSLFSIDSATEVIKLVRHLVGYEYSEDIYNRFTKLRDLNS